MKLAEALLTRAEMQKMLEQLRARLLGCSSVQEGDEPPEDPVELLAMTRQLFEDLVVLIGRINRTNVMTPFASEGSLADAIIRREHLIKEREILKELANATVKWLPRYSKSEIRLVSTVDVKEMRKQMDRISLRYRELDVKIQETNWTTLLQ